MHSPPFGAALGAVVAVSATQVSGKAATAFIAPAPRGVGWQPATKPEQEIGPIVLTEDVIEAVKPLLLGCGHNTTDVKKALRACGGITLASRIGKDSKCRNAAAHPDVGLLQELRSFVSLHAAPFSDSEIAVEDTSAGGGGTGSEGTLEDLHEKPKTIGRAVVGGKGGGDFGKGDMVLQKPHTIAKAAIGGKGDGEGQSKTIGQAAVGGTGGGEFGKFDELQTPHIIVKATVGGGKCDGEGELGKRVQHSLAGVRAEVKPTCCERKCNVGDIEVMAKSWTDPAECRYEGKTQGESVSELPREQHPNSLQLDVPGAGGRQLEADKLCSKVTDDFGTMLSVAVRRSMCPGIG